MYTNFTLIAVMVLSLLYQQYHEEIYEFIQVFRQDNAVAGIPGHDQFHYNINFDLLNRTVATLDTDNVNAKLDHSLLKPISPYAQLKVEFQHGVASGDPLSDKIILWTRITPEVPVSLSQYDLVPLSFKISDENDAIVQEGWTWTSSVIDYTVKLDIDGLSPDHRYSYQFQYSDSAVSTIGQTRTLPDPEDPLEDSSVKLAIYSCSNYAGGYYHAYKFPLIKQTIDFVIHLGDYIYEYSREEYVDGTEIGRAHEPAHECYTLEDYRIRYASYRLDLDLQASHAGYPWILVWDDHEVTDNSYHSGSVHSKGYEFVIRKDQATQAYFEWLPIRPVSLDRNKIWRGFQFGKLMGVSMLDTRNYDRDLTDIYDNQELIHGLKEYEQRSILGFDQEAWLERELMSNKESGIVWNFISSQCVVNSLNLSMPLSGGLGWPFEKANQDSWDGYVANRNRLLNFIKDNQLDNTVVLSGDFHIAIASELSLDGEEYDVKTGLGSLAVEFTTSAVSSPSTFPREFSYEQCLPLSEELVDQNNLVWNEGYWRGYYEMSVSHEEIHVKYFGVDVKKKQLNVSDEILLAEFTVKQGQNKIDRESAKAYRGVLNHAI
ncbi:hypothetical protein WICPIJ_005634 [Wickerhamomyces pijperi]|uniref:Alkaline phosphatase n=1 Tax=Wickerhamomyces pijperi TaxID=599730 RepID=A0A9P8Q5B8_WICPI|nr:hypothetical protein WICPIJ_005634 [Wickerhamomyces pijperi]